MPISARDRLANLLGDSQPAGADSVMFRLPGDALALEVDGLGRIRTPIRAAEAKRLAGAARPAQFGHGQETLTDASVRDTWEITPDQVSLECPTWQAHLDTALEHVCDELGLPAGAQLTAELHSMLVYGKGQFFLPHQDSEKHEEMVASLVVMLPSVHTGGELVVDDAGREKTYRGSRDDLTLVAFYADRRHEVRPVRSGYRVTLTFNLLLTRPGETSAVGRTPEASSYLTEHFTTPLVSRYGGRDLGEPTRLVFLLDHEYTQGALAAGLFKGADAERVATLAEAAEHAGCQSVLVLAEIKETWEVLPGEDSWHRGWYGNYDDEYGDEPESDDGDYERTELLDDEMVLGWWANPDGSGAETIQLALDDDEVCAVTPTESLTPYETEYEGYMGNYGNTVDRWYRRAAVVVWPKVKSFAARAEAGSAWALQTLLDQIDAGDLDEARRDAASLEPFWRHVEPALLTPALRVAAGLGEAASARVVVAPFRVEMLTAEHAPLLAALAREYGQAWVLDLMETWMPSSWPVGFAGLAGQNQLPWISGELLPLCRALREHDGHRIADGFADRVWRWMRSRIETWVAAAHPERRRANLAELAVPLARVLEAASDELGASIAEELRASDDTVVDLMVPALRAHRPPPTPALAAVAADCRSRLTHLLDRPARGKNDWSIAWTGCGCEVCERLAEFLGAGSERHHEWPLAKRGRQHVHQQIDEVGLPVRHTTRRQGRPYTLVLAKTQDLFRGEDEVRRQAEEDLAWLVSALEQDSRRADVGLP